jgi:hypothetical protein
MSTVRIIFHLTTMMNAFDLSTATGWLNIFVYPLFISLGVTFGARRVQLVVSDTVDMNDIKERIFRHLNNNGLKIKTGDEYQKEFESTNSFNRLFSNWFGTEIISISESGTEIIIEGPLRHINTLDSKLRFDKNTASVSSQ